MDGEIRPFFIDHINQKTSWVDPRLKYIYHFDENLPEGWEQAIDDSGSVYYIDHKRQCTQRDHPLRAQRHSVPAAMEADRRRDSMFNSLSRGVTRLGPRSFSLGPEPKLPTHHQPAPEYGASSNPKAAESAAAARGGALDRARRAIFSFLWSLISMSISLVSGGGRGRRGHAERLEAPVSAPSDLYVHGHGHCPMGSRLGSSSSLSSCHSLPSTPRSSEMSSAGGMYEHFRRSSCDDALIEGCEDGVASVSAASSDSSSLPGTPEYPDLDGSLGEGTLADLRRRAGPIDVTYKDGMMAADNDGKVYGHTLSHAVSAMLGPGGKLTNRKE